MRRDMDGGGKTEGVRRGSSQQTAKSGVSHAFIFCDGESSRRISVGRIFRDRDADRRGERVRANDQSRLARMKFEVQLLLCEATKTILAVDEAFGDLDDMRRGPKLLLNEFELFRESTRKLKLCGCLVNYLCSTNMCGLKSAITQGFLLSFAQLL